MGPGPSEIHPRVFSAMGRPTIGYLDPVFVGMMEELKELLKVMALNRFHRSTENINHLEHIKQKN